MVDVDYYDAVLVGIAASMLAGVLLALFTPVSREVGIVAGTVAATVFVYGGMFRNPPLPEEDSRATTAAVAWHVIALLIILAQIV